MMKIHSKLSTRDWLYIGLGILFVIYVGFQTRYLIFGPQLSIETPEDGAVVHEPAVTISGKATNVAYISLNGRQIFTDEEGRWSEKLIVAEGVSIMTVRVRDRFGREKVENVRILLN
jgi:hypothetical protein